MTRRAAQVVLVVDAVAMLAYLAAALVVELPVGGIVIGMTIILGTVLLISLRQRGGTGRSSPASGPGSRQERWARGRRRAIIAAVACALGLAASLVLGVAHLVVAGHPLRERRIFFGAAFAIAVGCLVGLAAAVHWARTVTGWLRGQ